MTRRDLLKSMAARAAVSAAEAMFPGVVWRGSAAPRPPPRRRRRLPTDGVAWKKTPCRFCGVGCGLLVGIKDDRAVAVKGDPASTVNKGLCCVKGYHSVLALYGKDRLRQALVRKNGKLVPVPMKEALDLVAAKMKETIAQHGKDSVAMYGSGQWTIPDGYVASKFMKGCIGTNNLEGNARLCMSSAVTGFMTSLRHGRADGLLRRHRPRRCLRALGQQHGRDASGAVLPHARPARSNSPDVKIIDLATRTTRTSMAADRSILFRPQTDLAIANAICYEIMRNGWHQPGVHRASTALPSKARPISATGSRTKNRFKDEPQEITLRGVPQAPRRLYAREGGAALRRAGATRSATSPRSTATRSKR